MGRGAGRSLSASVSRQPPAFSCMNWVQDCLVALSLTSLVSILYVPVHQASLQLVGCPCVSPVTESSAVMALESAKGHRKKNFGKRHCVVAAEVGNVL